MTAWVIHNQPSPPTARTSPTSDLTTGSRLCTPKFKIPVRGKDTSFFRQSATRMLSKGIPGDAKPVKICGVCGDYAKSYHFGGISCDSCKAFFRRSVQNDNFRMFQCAFHKNCDITMANRKCCQYCRFRKCLDIGMETSWVMSEKERLLMVRARMEKKQQQQKEVSSGQDVMSTTGGASSPIRRQLNGNDSRTPSPAAKRMRLSDDDGSNLLWPTEDFLDMAEREEVDSLVNLFDCSAIGTKDDDDSLQATFKSASALQNADPEYVARWMVVVHFVTSIQKLVRFARGIQLFAQLSVRDQISLLRANIFEMFLAVHFGLRDPSPPSATSSESSEDSKVTSGGVNCSFLTAGESIVPRDSAYGTLFRSLIPDIPTLVLLLAVILFGPDLNDPPQGVSEKTVETLQLHYCNLLDKQLKQTHGAAQGSSALARVLLLLPTLREIRDKHVAYHFDVHGQDVDLAEGWMFQKEDSGSGVKGSTEFESSTCLCSEP